jgi:transposase-like protein
VTPWLQGPNFAQPKSLIFLDAGFFLDEYRAVFLVNVTSPYLYRAIDSHGDTVEFWLSERRNLTAAKRFLRKALERHGRPERIVIDGSQANREAILSCDAERRLQECSRRHLQPVRIRQSRYLNNRIEQDHRAIKRRIRPMLGFKSINSARVILGGIELIHMMRKQQANYAHNPQPSLEEQFHLLAA